MPDDRSLSIAAHAKLNLALWVGPADPASKPPGLHPICSWMVPIDLADTLSLAALPDGAASRHEIQWAPDAPRPSPIDWPLENDLAVRAHRLLEQHAGRPLPINLRLEKRTPVGGGLGGGSSDAAAALLGLNNLFSLGLSAADLRSLSAQLGSDVAFFIDDPADPTKPPRAAIVSGFGDGIERLEPAPSTAVALIFPPFGCPTGAVYRAFDSQTREATTAAQARDLTTSAGQIPFDRLFNDLAAPAIAVEPRLGEILDALSRVGLTAHVTGSGSTLFAPLPSAPANHATALARIRAACPTCAVLSTRTPGLSAFSRS